MRFDFGKIKSIRWCIFYLLASLAGVKALGALISGIVVLRWHPEITSAFGLNSIEFALLGCFNIGLWTAIAAVTWALRREKDTIQRTPLKRFLMSILLTVWVVGVFLLFAYDKAAATKATKAAIPNLIEQIIQRDYK